MGAERWYWGRIGILAAGLLPLMPSHAVLPMQTPAGGASVQDPVLPIDRELARDRVGDESPFGNRELQARQLRRIREEHQKQVFADTARLLQLATTLKEQADKGAKPSPGTLKDVDEIAKLAKRLSERIKNQ